jgi:hypothetical protein
MKKAAQQRKLRKLRDRRHKEQFWERLVKSEKQFTQNEDAVPCSDHPMLKPLGISVVIWFTWVALVHLSRGQTLTGIEIAEAVVLTMLLLGLLAAWEKNRVFMFGRERYGIICQLTLGFVGGLMATISLLLETKADR